MSTLGVDRQGLENKGLQELWSVRERVQERIDNSPSEQLSNSGTTRYLERTFSAKVSLAEDSPPSECGSVSDADGDVQK